MSKNDGPYCNVCNHPAREHKRGWCAHVGCLCQVSLDDLLEAGFVDE